jgi:hypothetical protein
VVFSSNIKYDGSNDPNTAANNSYIDAAGANNTAGIRVFMKGNGNEGGTYFRIQTAPTSVGAGSALASLNTRFHVGGDGQVGINNGSPSHNLDVSGTFRTTGAATFDGNIIVAGTVDGVDVAGLVANGEYSSTYKRNIVQYNRFGSNQDMGGTSNWEEGIYGGYQTMTNGPTGMTYDPFLVMGSGTDVRSFLVVPRTASRPIAYKGSSTSGATHTAWHYTGWTTTAADADLTKYLRSDVADTAAGKITFDTGLARSGHNVGHLEGSYNNIGNNQNQSNPIYTIGSSYNPNTTALVDMYGIGYTNTSATFIDGFQTASGGWGMYVAADGESRIFLNGSLGDINIIGDLTSDNVYINNAIYHLNDTNTYMQFHNNDQWRVVVSGNERLEVKNSTPHVLVTGNQQTTGTLLVQGNATLGNASTDAHTVNGTLTITNDLIVDTDTLFVDVSTDRVGINDSTPSYSLDVAGTINATIDVQVSSDIRLKNELPDIVQGLEAVDKLRPIKYTLKDDEDENPKIHLGFSAQELLDIVPEVVRQADDDGYYSVAYQKLVPVLVKAIQELTEEVRELKKKVEE